MEAAAQIVMMIMTAIVVDVETNAVIPKVDATPIITSVALNPDGSFRLNLTGATGYTYVVESAASLGVSGSWLPLNTNTLGTNSVWHFDDEQATNFPHRFYRVKLVP